MADSRKRADSSRPSGKSASKRKPFNLTFLVIALVLIYIAAQFFSFFNKDTINYIVAKQGEIVEKFSAQGVIIRQEELVKSSSGGIVQYYYPGGKELEKGTLVASILDDYYGDILQDKINQIYDQISDIDDGEYSDAFQALDTSIESTVSSYLRNKAVNNYSNLYALKDNLADAISKRKDMYSLMSNTQVASLLAQQGIYINEQDSVRSNLYLSEGGMIDYSYDGYEGWTADQIGPDFISNYDSSYQYFDINFQNIDSGTPLYRLITSPVWQIVIYLNKDQAQYFSGESSVDFIYNSTKELSGTIQSLEQTKEDQYKLVIKLTSHVQDFLNDRTASLVFTKNQHTGIKISDSCLVQKTYYVVPSECIVRSGSQTGLLAVQADDSVIFQPVDVATENDDKTYFTLPDGVSPGFTIQKENSTERMTQGSTESVNGVYVVNGGYEQFVIVTIEYQAQGYAIVKGIKMYDRVKIIS